MNKKPVTTPHKIKLGRWEFTLPRTKFGRIFIGVLLILGGLLWFLPILGFWMMPLGFVVLARDLPWFRRFNRRISAWWARRKKKK